MRPPPSPRDLLASAGGCALDIIIVALVDPRHHPAQLAADLLDRVRFALGAQRAHCADVGEEDLSSLTGVILLDLVSIQ